MPAASPERLRGYERVITSGETPGVHRSLLRNVVWWTGATLLLAITVTAIWHLIEIVGRQVTSSAVLVALAWVVGLATGLVMAIGGLLAYLTWASQPKRSAVAVLGAGLALTAAIRFATTVVVHAPLVSDWRTYYEIAISILHGGDWFRAVPTGYPLMLAPLFWLFGPHPTLAEMLNVMLGLWTAGMVFVLVHHLAGLTSAAAALYLYALVPSQALMSAVVGTEIAYGAFVVTAVTVAVVMGRRDVRWTILLGVVLGLSQYVRTTSVFLLPAFIGLVWVLHPTPRALKRSLLLGIVFVVVTLPAILANLGAGAGFTVSTSRYGGWSLLIGLNPATVGRYNLADLRLIGLRPGTVAWDKRANQLAIDRLTRSPVGQTATVIVKKFPRFWGLEDYGAEWTARPPWDLSSAAGRIELVASQLVYAVVLLLAFVGIALRPRSRDPARLLIAALLVIVAVLHSFVEIQTRYHSYLIPLLCVLAALAVGNAFGRPAARAGRRWINRRPTPQRNLGRRLVEGCPEDPV